MRPKVSYLLEAAHAAARQVAKCHGEGWGGNAKAKQMRLTEALHTEWTGLAMPSS
jgi:hypothetical protein